MKPTLAQRFTIRPTHARTQVAADAQANGGESWWIRYATGPRDEQFAAADALRFPAMGEKPGPALKTWVGPV